MGKSVGKNSCVATILSVGIEHRASAQNLLLRVNERYGDVMPIDCVLKIRELPRALRTSTQQNDATLRLER